MTAKKTQPQPVAAPAAQTESKAKYVAVASKLPFNLLIQLCAPKTARVTGQFGSVEETVHVKQGREYLIRGTSYPEGGAPKGFPKRPEMIEDNGGGYAVTKGIPADFFKEWLRQNADTDMVRNGVIKAEADLDDLAANAREHEDVSSGLGPLNPDGDRRNPKPLSGAVQEVKPEVRAAA